MDYVSSDVCSSFNPGLSHDELEPGWDRTTVMKLSRSAGGNHSGVAPIRKTEMCVLCAPEKKALGE